MTRESYAQATRLLDKINKIERVVTKIKQEFPEAEYDPDYRDIFEDVFRSIKVTKLALEAEFKKL